MNPRRFVAIVSIVATLVSLAGFVRVAQAQTDFADVTPARLSYVDGDVSFWRPGAEDWAKATLNTALQPGDALHVGQGGNAEIQIGPRAFVRATANTQIGLDNHDDDYVQLRVTSGQAALDLRELTAGQTVELSTPNAAITVDRPGYYRVEADSDAVGVNVYRGGRAVVTSAHGSPATVTSDQQAIIAGADSARIEVRAAAPQTAWDRWNDQRTAYLLQPQASQYVSPGIYGAEELDRHGSWRTVETYGPVWMPRAVPAGWVPYSTGRWIWDPVYGWTWLDDAPWGWAPYHYGRWVFVSDRWAWAPGPVVRRPVYAPALVVFFGGGTVSVRRPLAWAPLAWGEPVLPWWGRAGFIGRPSWRGWGGPRIVNNVVVNNTTVVNAQTINVYRNAHVVNGVVGVPRERFGRERVQPTRLAEADVRQLAPVRGALEVKPTAASLMPAAPQAARPPAAIQERRVVSTRAPRDVTPELRAQGLDDNGNRSRREAPRIVPSPRSATGDAARPAADSPRTATPPRVERPDRDEPSAVRERERDDRPARRDRDDSDRSTRRGGDNSRGDASPAPRSTPPPPPAARTPETPDVSRPTPPSVRPEPPARTERAVPPTPPAAKAPEVRPQTPPRPDRVSPSTEPPSARERREAPPRVERRGGRDDSPGSASREITRPAPQPPAAARTPEPPAVSRPTPPPVKPEPQARPERAVPPTPPAARTPSADPPPARERRESPRVERQGGRVDSTGSASPGITRPTPPPPAQREAPTRGDGPRQGGRDNDRADGNRTEGGPGRQR